jgi:hypothetical protein
MTDTKRAVRNYAQAHKAADQAAVELSAAPRRPVPERRPNNAAAQKYLDSKRRLSVAPWFFGGLALGMLACAALDAFPRGAL